ncbi:hypothetical protein K458DRAFT_23048 [Lentithecium fluviatile CBS 122367]|uniref:Uncharacterized protein n=1 Tax=Lentithecium fluviatile CBS 122367 TaxID=1168545 RepID=A0A6G1J522_9PLEO|nr:hypothetical protein K458DRAFT_23048 [Lentithecium fluviatile CBS 122367]
MENNSKFIYSSSSSPLWLLCIVFGVAPLASIIIMLILFIAANSTRSRPLPHQLCIASGHRTLQLASHGRGTRNG